MATKAELQAELDAAGIAYKARDTVAELEALLAGSGAGVRTRTVEVIEQMVDGGAYWANSQMQVPGHDPIRFDDQGHGWIVSSYDGTTRDLTAVHREASVKVVDRAIRTKRVDVAVD